MEKKQNLKIEFLNEIDSNQTANLEYSIVIVGEQGKFIKEKLFEIFCFKIY
jgi:hypothetical protein